MSEYGSMVALGSSFAAGPGIGPVVDRAAGRSGANAAHLIAGALGARLVDATVSGASTATILDTDQRVGLRRFAPQIRAVSQGTDLVTITAGGNDLGYLSGIISTALLHRLRRSRLTRPAARAIRVRFPLVPTTAEQEDVVTAGLARIVAGVRDRAPEARVMLVDYLPIFTDDFVPGVSGPFTAAEVEHFRGVAAVLSRAVRSAAERSGADHVPASAFGQAHGVGSPTPWIDGSHPLRRSTSSFHPNAAGMVAVAQVVLDRLRSPSPP